MSIILGGITLPDLINEDEFTQSQVRSEVGFTLGGKVLTWEQLVSFKNITLVGKLDRAWIARLDLQSLFALSAVPNATYILEYEGVSHTVRFRNEEPPVISATPILGRPNAEDDDYYQNLTIKLMEV